MPKRGLTSEEKAIVDWLRADAEKIWQQRSWRIWQWYGRWLARNACRAIASLIVYKANVRRAEGEE